ncbi:MAG: permease prefix domain 1-containing protein [Eubacterium sp.]
MEAIKEYLSNMFLNLPETPQVLRAKAELMEMMEDKYEELIEQGMSEKEAVGTVISEFGNLDELAEELGIGDFIKKEEEGEEKKSRHAERRWGLEETKGYLSFAKIHARYIALGVLLCIWGPFVESIMEGAIDQGYIGTLVGGLVGNVCMFLMIGVAVVLFVLASTRTKEYGKINRYTIALEEEAAAYVRENQKIDEKRRVLTTCIGIFLCIFSVVPSMGSGLCKNLFGKAILDSSVLFIVGIAVFLLVSGCSLRNRYEDLAKAVQNYEREQSPNVGVTANPIYEKKKVPAVAIVLIVIFGVLVLSLGAIIPIAIYHYHGNTSTSTITTQITSEVQSAEDQMAPISSVRIDADLMTLNMEVSDEVTKPEFNYEGEESRKPTFHNKNGEISIKSRKGFSVHLPFTNITQKCTLTVKIPTAMYQNTKLNIKLDAGDVHLTRIPNGEVSVDLDAGNLIVSECTLDRIDVDADAGNVELKNNRINEVESEVDAGNFEMDFDGPKGAYAYDLSADLGNVSINGEKHAGMETEYKAPKDTDVLGYATYRQVKVEADLGNIEIRTK